MYKILLIVCLQVCITLVLSKKIPDYIHVCKRNDPNLNQCVINVFNEIRPYLREGIPELNLPPGDPLRYPNASANNQGSDSSVTLDATSWNQTATGLMDANIKDIKLDLDNGKSLFDLELPYVRLQGNYKFYGKVLLFEIDTTGTFDINATDVTAETEAIGKLYTKDGQQHIKFDRLNLRLKIPKSTVYFTNLINGNEGLTQTLNQAINENIEGIIEELEPIIASTFGEIFRQYFNKFFGTFSIDELFPNE